MRVIVVDLAVSDFERATAFHAGLGLSSDEHVRHRSAHRDGHVRGTVRSDLSQIG